MEATNPPSSPRDNPATKEGLVEEEQWIGHCQAKERSLRKPPTAVTDSNQCIYDLRWKFRVAVVFYISSQIMWRHGWRFPLYKCNVRKKKNASLSLTHLQRNLDIVLCLAAHVLRIQCDDVPARLDDALQTAQWCAYESVVFPNP